MGPAASAAAVTVMGSHGMGFISLGKLTSTQLDGTVAAKTYPSINETSGSIAHQSSTTLSVRQ